jgi:hypothetical protein
MALRDHGVWPCSNEVVVESSTDPQY